MGKYQVSFGGKSRSRHAESQRPGPEQAVGTLEHEVPGAWGSQSSREEKWRNSKDDCVFLGR